jgi:hypothetical protein
MAAGLAYVHFNGAKPRYRIEYLLDTSVSPTINGLADLKGAVGEAALNAGDSDAVALRTFGGGCGDPASTRLLVESGTKKGRQVAAAVATITAFGQPTLSDGIAAAIHDFAGRRPPRATALNRIVVITNHAADACGSGQDLKAAAAATGISLQIRLVGYKLPPTEQLALTHLAIGAGAPTPAFAEDQGQLAAVVDSLGTGDVTVAQHVNTAAPSSAAITPSSTPATSPAPKPTKSPRPKPTSTPSTEPVPLEEDDVFVGAAIVPETAHTITVDRVTRYNDFGEGRRGARRDRTKLIPDYPESGCQCWYTNRSTTSRTFPVAPSVKILTYYGGATPSYGPFVDQAGDPSKALPNASFATFVEFMKGVKGQSIGKFLIHIQHRGTGADAELVTLIALQFYS